MRKIILLAAVALPFPAFATLPVIDSASLAQLVRSIQAGEQRYQELVANYQQLQATYRMFTHINSINGAIGAFQMSGLENAMPDTSAVPGMVGGGYAPNQWGGNLGAYSQQYYNQNNVYTPQGNDWAARQMRADAYRTAEIQGEATANLNSIQQRESVVLPRLQSELANAHSITDVQNIDAQEAAESNYLQSQQAQVASLRLAAYEQRQADRNAAMQYNRQGADQAIASTCQSIAADGGSSGLCAGQP